MVRRKKMLRWKPPAKKPKGGRDWGRTKKPTGRFHPKAGVQLSLFIRDHLLSSGGDHIYSTYSAYKEKVRRQEHELGFRRGHYRVGSYMTTKYYFYLLKTLGLIEVVTVLNEEGKAVPVVRKGSVGVLKAKPIVYKVVVSVNDAWNKPRKYYAEMKGLRK